VREWDPLLEKSDKFLSSAQLLLDNTDFDSSVSRSYYAMFYAAEALLMTKDLKFSSHKGVLSAFGQHFVKTGLFPKEVQRKLQKAFDERQRSDYSFQPGVNQADARQILQDAREFVDQAKKYLQGVTPKV
jgi:uncharacterized protein (UPF0332 family)